VTRAPARPRQVTDLWVKAPALVALFDDEEDPVTAAQKQYLQLGFTYYGNVVESIGATLQEALTQVRKTPSWPRSWANFTLL
jgi:hypothetical protein